MNRSVRHSFTIIELIVVTFIIGIILTLTLAPFDKLVTVAGVDGGANMISTQLRACRQHAVGKRMRVALVMYRNEMAQAIRPAQLDKDNQFSAWTENSSWTFLPTGAVVEEVTNEETLSFAAGDLEPIAAVAGSYPAIIFKPTGKLDHGATPTIKVSDALPTGTTTYTARGDGKNWLLLSVNRFTGQITVSEPGP